MIPGPATFDPLIAAAVHLAIGIYFLRGLFQKRSAGAKIFFSFCCLAMLIFTYDDLLGFPPP